MKAPENFTRGDIPDELFYEALDAALEKKSKVRITQILKHGGANQSIIDAHADRFLNEAKRLRSRALRPHRMVAWCIVGSGLAILGYLWTQNIISGTALAITPAGVLMLAYLKD